MAMDTFPSPDELRGVSLLKDCSNFFVNEVFLRNESSPFTLLAHIFVLRLFTVL